MKLILEHLPISLLVGMVGWLISSDLLCFVAALVSGWLIDVDHIMDFFYYVFRTRDSNALKLLKSGEYFKLNGKVFVPLHSWELTLVLGFLSVLYQSYVFGCAAVAMGIHLLQDQFSYRVRVSGYFLISRAANKFKIEKFCQLKN